MEQEFYDGVKLLSQKDLNGNTPEIFLCTTNRSAGKTTYFNRLLVNKFKQNGEKFGLLYRYKYELDDCADKFFKDINTLFFPTDEMYSKSQAQGVYHILYLNKKPCGYAFALNSADQIKKYSHLFSDVKRLLMDEFQSETNNYCPDEVKKFRSIHTSVARGQGQQVRYVPVYMISNPVTLLNPYYVSMGITTRLNDKTKFFKGKGFVLEQGFNDTASKQQLESGFNQAFEQDQYTEYLTQGVYLNDNKAFIERPPVNDGRYLVTLRYNGKEYAVREYREQGFLYCDDRPDRTFPHKLSVTTDDHQVNYVMLKANNMFVLNLRYFFEQGCFRFKDLSCKEVILKCISY